jgi:hypothetical protein
MPDDGLTHGPPATKSGRQSPQVQPGSSDLPCAMILTVSFVLSSVTMFGCHRRP